MTSADLFGHDRSRWVSMDELPSTLLAAGKDDRTSDSSRYVHRVNSGERMQPAKSSVHGDSI